MKIGLTVEASRAVVGSVRKKPLANNPAAVPTTARGSIVKSMNQEAFVFEAPRATAPEVARIVPPASETAVPVWWRISIVRLPGVVPVVALPNRRQYHFLPGCQ